MGLSTILPLLLACGPSEPGPVHCGSDEILDGEICVPEACGTGTWGDLETDGDTIYVDASAEDGGDGSKDRPFTVIQAGIDAQGQYRMVAVAAGTYVENLYMDSDQSGVHLAGRCRELVIVDGSEGSTEGYMEGSGIYLDQTGVLTKGWTVTDLTLSGAPFFGVMQSTGTLTLDRLLVTGNQDGGIETTKGSVEIRDTRVENNQGVGMYFEASEVVLDGVEVLEPAPGELVATGIGVNDSTIEITDTLVRGQRGQGIGLLDSTGVLRDVRVLDLLPSGSTGTAGGLMLTGGSEVTVTDCTVQGALGYGIGIEDSSATLQRVQVLDVEDVQMEDAGHGVGVIDGVLVAEDCTVGDNGEFGVLAQGSELVMSDCSLVENQEYGIYLVESVAGLDGVWVEDTAPTEEDEGGVGIYMLDSTVTLEHSTLIGNTTSGLWSGSSELTLDTVEVLDTYSDPSGDMGYGMDLAFQSTVTATDCLVRASRGCGILVRQSELHLERSEVVQIRRGTLATLALGVVAQQESTVTATDLVSQANEGMGVYVMDSSMECDGCTLSD
ncbi:MAG: right-handed parallel beta-helix repeat-containing protein, partial [Myxococcota bacterium]|nr:right-handed parallel beta-helix repeat-containing protein [Myxococcota bacterium]